MNFDLRFEESRLCESATGPQRIVCLTEETVEWLYLLGESDRIVGISGFVMRPPEARRENLRSVCLLTLRSTQLKNFNLIS